MKGCLNDPRTRLSEHDYQQLQQFRCELELQARLQNEGHTEDCALGQVFEGLLCACRPRADGGKTGGL